MVSWSRLCVDSERSQFVIQRDVLRQTQEDHEKTSNNSSESERQFHGNLRIARTITSTSQCPPCVCVSSQPPWQHYHTRSSVAETEETSVLLSAITCHYTKIENWIFLSFHRTRDWICDWRWSIDFHHMWREKKHLHPITLVEARETLFTFALYPTFTPLWPVHADKHASC